MPVVQSSNTVELVNGIQSVKIYYFGATISSWKIGENEKLFQSQKAILDGTKAIRGGMLDL